MLHLLAGAIVSLVFATLLAAYIARPVRRLRQALLAGAAAAPNVALTGAGDDVEGVCCGVPFSSKGYTEANAFAANRAIERFWAWSDEGASSRRARARPPIRATSRIRPAISKGRR